METHWNHFLTSLLSCLSAASGDCLNNLFVLIRLISNDGKRTEMKLSSDKQLKILNLFLCDIVLMHFLRNGIGKRSQ